MWPTNGHSYTLLMDEVPSTGHHKNIKENILVKITVYISEIEKFKLLFSNTQ